MFNPKLISSHFVAFLVDYSLWTVKIFFFNLWPSYKNCLFVSWNPSVTLHQEKKKVIRECRANLDTTYCAITIILSFQSFINWFIYRLIFNFMKKVKSLKSVLVSFNLSVWNRILIISKSLAPPPPPFPPGFFEPLLSFHSFVAACSLLIVSFGSEDLVGSNHQSVKFWVDEMVECL